MSSRAREAKQQQQQQQPRRHDERQGSHRSSQHRESSHRSSHATSEEHRRNSRREGGSQQGAASSSGHGTRHGEHGDRGEVHSSRRKAAGRGGGVDHPPGAVEAARRKGRPSILPVRTAVRIRPGATVSVGGVEVGAQNALRATARVGRGTAPPPTTRAAVSCPFRPLLVTTAFVLLSTLEQCKTYLSSLPRSISVTPTSISRASARRLPSPTQLSSTTSRSHPSFSPSFAVHAPTNHLLQQPHSTHARPNHRHEGHFGVRSAHRELGDDC